MTDPARILVVDNRDSFVHNLVHYLQELGASVEVRGNRTFPPDEVYDPGKLGVDGVLISPGPGRPEDAGSSVELIHGCARTGVPLLGVCLGHQAIAVAYGGVVGPAPELHPRQHERDLPRGRRACCRAAQPVPGDPLPLVGGRGRTRCRPSSRSRRAPQTAPSWACGTGTSPLEGVQFHPESVLSEGGHELLANWLADLRRGLTRPS